jgi:hypothetical protein
MTLGLVGQAHILRRIHRMYFIVGTLVPAKVCTGTATDLIRLHSLI